MNKFILTIALGTISLLIYGLVQAGGGDPYTPTVTGQIAVTSSSEGKEVIAGFNQGAYINSTGSGCIARLDDCTQLTTCVGLPVAADSGVALNRQNDSPGKWCVIKKSGASDFTVSANVF